MGTCTMQLWLRCHGTSQGDGWNSCDCILVAARLFQGEPSNRMHFYWTMVKCFFVRGNDHHVRYITWYLWYAQVMIWVGMDRKDTWAAESNIQNWYIFNDLKIGPLHGIAGTILRGKKTVSCRVLTFSSPLPAAHLYPNPDNNQIDTISSRASSRCRLLSRYIQCLDSRFIRTIPHCIQTRNLPWVILWLHFMYRNLWKLWSRW